MILKSQREIGKNWASRNADEIASSIWWVPILSKQYIKIWCMIWLLNHLETNWNSFWCADRVPRQEIARSSRLTVINELIICRHDSCARMQFARTHNGFNLSKKWMDRVVLFSLALLCDFERSIEERLRCEKLMCAKTLIRQGWDFPSTEFINVKKKVDL